jgi:DNA-binding NarL/FixJ family response regulator
MEKNIELVLVDDHKLFRDGLKYVLGQVDYINVIGEASDGTEFMKLLETVQPEIVLMDIAMPRMNGIEATRASLKLNPELKIIALTMFDDERYYYDILNAGAKGFVLKDSNSEILLNAIKAIYKGESYFSNEILVKVIRSYSNFSDQKNSEEHNETIFTEQELTVLKMICTGMSNKEISEKLSATQKSIEGIRSGLLKKTNSSNSLSLVLYAIENNILSDCP